MTSSEKEKFLPNSLAQRAKVMVRKVKVVGSKPARVLKAGAKMVSLYEVAGQKKE